MHELTASNKADGPEAELVLPLFRMIPLPQTMGLFTLLITILAFTAGSIRNELVLILVGMVFLLALSWCFVAVLGLPWLLRKKVRSSSVRILTKQMTAGTTGSLSFALGPGYIQGKAGKKQFFRFPGILLRYEMNLATKDGRCIRHIFDPDFLPQGISYFPVPERGAYYSTYHGFTIADVLGFFSLSIPLPQDTSPQVLASPKTGETNIRLQIRSRGLLQQNEPQFLRTDPHFLRTDNFIDHRPYMPGDDPRRINWKLYGHAGDLFVREGEPEPPPHSRILILVDTQADDTLYTPAAACKGVDLLCENALSLAIAYTAQGLDLSIAYTGGDIHRGTQAELAIALAYPSALPLKGPEDLPSPEDEGLLILALPRALGGESALDRFLQQRNTRQGVDIVFVYEGSSRDEAAETAVGIYGQKSGDTTRCIRIDP
ncbi:MAG: DUF58 domain-containing protein [Treponema sp.]|nr:DUF58 domain-containing protein [Treponema sp.]